MEGGVEPGNGPAYVLPGVTNPNPENQESLVQDSIRRTVESLLDQGHTVVLVYPIPEVGWHVVNEILLRASFANDFEIPASITNRIAPGLTRWPLARPTERVWPLDAPVTTSYDVYVDRNQSTFDALDSIDHERIIRIYPHEIFCDVREGGRCVTSDESNIFYIDDNHLSSAGARLVTDEIMKEISNWDPKP